MLPFIYIVSLCTLIVFRRDIQTIMYFGGFCVSEVCNYSLKRFFKQVRPERIARLDHFQNIFKTFSLRSDRLI
ncbi:unnamed protein product [Rotaria sordida]|uniref:Uncharacterized protein n=1 Tax=Rotaria sordida TaxID=392033 RepID=A0A815K721_9BILA|nr:unnamed protein product [Rotaria sordida]CAF1619491.1 unnamed protein product [Rotaria sordida]